MTSLPVAGFAGHPRMLQAGTAGTVGERICCLLLLCQEVLWVQTKDGEFLAGTDSEVRPKVMNPEYLELAVMRDALLGDKPKNGKPAIPAQHPAIGSVLSAQREGGFQFATGRTSVVCAALSTLVPQGIHGELEQSGGLSASWDCSLIKSCWLKAEAFRLEIKHTFERQGRLTGKLGQEKNREFSFKDKCTSGMCFRPCKSFFNRVVAT